MDVQIWTYIIVGFTFAIYIGIAIWSRAGSTKEFYVAGGGVSPLANGLATAADWMSAASFLGMAGIISFRKGWLCILDGLDWRICSPCTLLARISKEVWKVYSS